MLNLSLQSDREKLEELIFNSGVYAILNLYNDKYYIGSSVKLKQRWYSHLRHLKLGTHRNRILQRVFNKHGNVFLFVVLENLIPNKTILLEREDFWINELKACDRTLGYNINSLATSQLGSKRTQETKDKISAANKGRTHSAEVRANMSKSHLGKTQSQESRIKRSLSSKGRVHSPEAIAKMSAAKKGKPVSEDQKKRLKTLQLGRKHSEETKAKMSAAKMGRRFSEEAKINMRNAALARQI